MRNKLFCKNHCCVSFNLFITCGPFSTLCRPMFPGLYLPYMETNLCKSKHMAEFKMAASFHDLNSEESSEKWKRKLAVRLFRHF